MNIVIPVIILVRFSGEDQLGPVNGLLVALAFPVGYGLYDFIVRRGFNPYSMLGFASVLLTGGIGLLKLPVGVAGDQGGGDPVHHLRGGGGVDADALPAREDDHAQGHQRGAGVRGAGATAERGGV